LYLFIAPLGIVEYTEIYYFLFFLFCNPLAWTTQGSRRATHSTVLYIIAGQRPEELHSISDFCFGKRLESEFVNNALFFNILFFFTKFFICIRSFCFEIFLKDDTAFLAVDSAGVRFRFANFLERGVGLTRVLVVFSIIRAFPILVDG